MRVYDLWNRIANYSHSIKNKCGTSEMRIPELFFEYPIQYVLCIVVLIYLAID